MKKKGKKDKWVKLPQNLSSQDAGSQKDKRNSLKGWSYLNINAASANNDPNTQQVNNPIRQLLVFLNYRITRKEIFKDPMITLQT